LILLTTTNSLFLFPSASRFPSSLPLSFLFLSALSLSSHLSFFLSSLSTASRPKLDRYPPDLFRLTWLYIENHQPIVPTFKRGKKKKHQKPQRFLDPSILLSHTEHQSNSHHGLLSCTRQKS